MIVEDTSEDVVSDGFTHHTSKTMSPEGAHKPDTHPKLHLKVLPSLVILMLLPHAGAAVGLYLAFTSAMWKTIIFAFVLDRLNMLAITAGAHRLWSHRSYKAKLPLRIFLMIFFTSSFQLSIYRWCRDHRVHHKYTETDADPHNMNRGFIFSHIGWMYRERHPDHLKALRSCEIKDLLADPVVAFNKKFYPQLCILLCYILPTVIPMYFWNESLQNAFFVAGTLREVTVLQETFCVNSFAHMFGSKPYDSTIKPTENTWISFICCGEGFHNYHHVFPYDYSTSELGMKLNMATAFINFMNWLGLAYDLKSVPKTTVEARKRRNEIENLKKAENACVG